MTANNQYKEGIVKIEKEPIIDPYGFREYDARWFYPKNINLHGCYIVGKSIAHQLKEKKLNTVVIGHDYRSYSEKIKFSIIQGLLEGGCDIVDVGLSISPMVYFGHYHFKTDAGIMVTASHNENGWTGLKIGANFPLTYGPEEMNELKEIALKKNWKVRDLGSYKFVDNFDKEYKNQLTKKYKLTNKIKVVVSCGNGTASIFAPEILKAIGCEVVEQNCDLDYTFPNHNPNPENLEMLNSLSQKVIDTKSDIGFAFDGDGDRIGIVDEKGEAIFSDKVGLIIARYISEVKKDSKFIVDIKSTGLFAQDPILRKNGAEVEYWKTGHSYMKKRVYEKGALAGFEKSGHFIFSPPYGKGYDDAMNASIFLSKIISEESNTSISSLLKTLKTTYQSPTMGVYCADKHKYEVVEKVTNYFINCKSKGVRFLDQKIINLIAINGIRLELEDGTWGLIRASSNKPSLVVVIESPISNQQMHNMFNEINIVLKQHKEIGEYDQKI